jgi:hypothetical protein
MRHFLRVVALASGADVAGIAIRKTGGCDNSGGKPARKWGLMERDGVN